MRNFTNAFIKAKAVVLRSIYRIAGGIFFKISIRLQISKFVCSQEGRKCIIVYNASNTIFFCDISLFTRCLGCFFVGGQNRCIAVFIVILFVFAFGKASTGILMPLLIGGDIFAIIYYKKHAHWKYVFILIPWMILGVVLGTYFGELLDENSFKLGMATLILLTTLLLLYWERYPLKGAPNHWSFGSGLGILAGFTTMVGNLAGAVTNIYFLPRLPRMFLSGHRPMCFYHQSV